MQGYKTELSEEEKEKIIKEFLPFIKYTAYRLAWRVPPQLTVEDLVSVGLMGLLDALERFEEGRVKLKTYAEYRIKGAMLDELRAVDWVPRRLRKKMNTLKDMYIKLERKLGRLPEDMEVAEALKISLDEYYKTLQNADSAITISFEDFQGVVSAEDCVDVTERISVPAENDPLRILEEEDQKKILAKIIDKLPEKEKLVLSLYYWEEMTMKEIGKVLNLTEGRVCQLHNQALLRLKAKLESDAHIKEF